MTQESLIYFLVVSNSKTVWFLMLLLIMVLLLQQQVLFNKTVQKSFLSYRSWRRCSGRVLEIRPRSGWSHSVLLNAPPAACLTASCHWTQTTVSLRHFICNLITILITLNGIMMGNQCLRISEQLSSSSLKDVRANGLCGGRERCWLTIFNLESTYHVLVND